MPDPRPRPLPSIRYGNYDDPPASYEPAWPYPNRHFRLQRALRNTVDLAREAVNDGTAADQPSRDRSTAPLPRRRQRSFSHDEPERPPVASFAPSSEESRRRLDDGRRRAAKRRKLDGNTPLLTRLPIRYGHHGQVEPGRLKLEIVSCDGGEHTDPRNPSIYLGPYNILKLDKSVYCSERSSTSFVLRHADDTPFCLEKLHIVGPEHGFTAPVREGIVYVAMTLHDLQKYQDPPAYARRAGFESPLHVHRSRRYRQTSLRDSSERLTLTDALRDPEINAAYNEYPHRADGFDNLANQDDNYVYLPGPEHDFGADGDGQCEAPSPQDETSPAVSTHGLPVTLLSDEETGPEDTSSQEVLDYRLQRQRHARRRHELENWDREDRWHAELSGARRSSGYRWEPDGTGEPLATGPSEALWARASESQDVTSAPSGPAVTAIASQQGEGAVGKNSREPPQQQVDPAVTIARFHIRSAKHKVAIKFDPPVSGRFMLLKLWACGARGQNVDVQSVVAKGFGGQRFFPAVQVR